MNTPLLLDDGYRSLREAELAGATLDPEIARIIDLVKAGIMSREEARGILERMAPQIINLAADADFEPIKFDPDGRAARDMRALRESFDHIAPAIDTPLIESIIDRMAEDGYDPDVLIHGPRHTFRAETAEGVERGDLVTVDEGGMVRRAEEETPIGVALGDGLVRFGQAAGRATRAIRDMWGREWGGDGAMGSGGRRHWTGSQVARYGSIAIHASMAYGGHGGFLREQQRRPPPGQRVDGPQFKYTERFPPKVEAKAMELLRKFMSAEQYTAFIERADIELENKAGDHRLIINQNGSFKLLRGGRGAGIVMTSGNVRSYRFPLGDEIAAFLDWFRYKTPELIQNWNCGNFGIVRDGTSAGLDERR